MARAGEGGGVDEDDFVVGCGDRVPGGVDGRRRGSAKDGGVGSRKERAVCADGMREAQVYEVMDRGCRVVMSAGLQTMWLLEESMGRTVYGDSFL